MKFRGKKNDDIHHQILIQKCDVGGRHCHRLTTRRPVANGSDPKLRTGPLSEWPILVDMVGSRDTPIPKSEPWNPDFMKYETIIWL